MREKALIEITLTLKGMECASVADARSMGDIAHGEAQMALELDLITMREFESIIDAINTLNAVAREANIVYAQ